MIEEQHIEAIARRFCEIRGIDPSESVKVAGQKMEKWQLAACQVRDTFAVNQATREIMEKLPVPGPGFAPRIVRSN